MDYRRPLQFGIFPAPETAALPLVLETAQLADESGLDLIGIQDHPYQRRYVDTWMLMATIMARTERVRVFPDVANLPLRPPAVMAKAAASLDVISEGRFELGLGAGAFWEAIVAMGGQARRPAEALAALEEAIDIIRLMWSDERSVSYEGVFYSVNGVKPGPRPAHDLGIWLGVTGPRALGLLGRKADGWVPSHSYVPPERLAGMHSRIDEAATAAGRDPAGIVRVYNVFGQINRVSTGPLNGPVDQWIDELTEFAVGYGMDTFIFGPAIDPAGQIRQFANEVVPAVREQVAKHRGE